MKKRGQVLSLSHGILRGTYKQQRGSWADTNQLHPTVCPVITDIQKNLGPLALRRLSLASSGSCVL